MSKLIFQSPSKGYCTKCDTEQIISKGSVNCPSCFNELIVPTLDYKDIWLSPTMAIYRLRDLAKKYGDRAMTHNQFKPEREAWISAMWALGMSEIYGKFHWIEIETDQATPDTHVYIIDSIENKNHRGIYEVEVMEWESHGGELIDEIKKKCDKNYPKQYTLLIYGNKPNAIINMDGLFRAVSKLNVPFAQIWLLIKNLNLEAGDFQLTQLYPHPNMVIFNPLEGMEKIKNQVHFAKMLKRDVGTEPKNLGILYLPIPDLKSYY